MSKAEETVRPQASTALFRKRGSPGRRAAKPEEEDWGAMRCTSRPEIRRPTLAREFIVLKASVAVPFIVSGDLSRGWIVIANRAALDRRSWSATICRTRKKDLTTAEKRS